MDTVDSDETLRRLVARVGPLPVAKAAAVGRRIAEAVARLHESDTAAGSALDPENVGIAWDDAGAPEVLLPRIIPGGAEPDFAGDIPRIGALLYELLAGSPPRGPASPPPVQRARPDLPESLGWLVMQCFHPTPAGRPRSAAEIARRLAPFEAELEDEAEEEQASAPTAPGLPPPAAPPRERSEAPLVPPPPPPFELEASNATTRIESLRQTPILDPRGAEPAAPAPAPVVREVSPAPESPRTRPISTTPEPAGEVRPIPPPPPKPEPPPPAAARPSGPVPRSLEDKTFAADLAGASALEEARLHSAEEEKASDRERGGRSSRGALVWMIALLAILAAAVGLWVVVQNAGAPASAPPAEARSAAARRPVSPAPLPAAVAPTAEPAAAPTPAPSPPGTPVAVETPVPTPAASPAAAAASPPPSAPTGAPAAIPPTAAAQASALPGSDGESERLRESLDAWIDSINARDLSGHMRLYMPRVAPFRGSPGASSDAVWREKARLLEGQTDVRASRPEIVFSPDGNSATMRFRKSWVAPGRDARRRESREELRWVKTSRGWRIAGETGE